MNCIETDWMLETQLPVLEKRFQEKSMSIDTAWFSFVAVITDCWFNYAYMAADEIAIQAPAQNANPVIWYDYLTPDEAGAN
jgi:hypothetical protein